MCGRFTLVSDLDLILHRFQLVNSNIEHVQRYNIAPSQMVLSILSDGEERRAEELRWGLIPFWARDKKIGFQMINARAETLTEKPTFKHPFKRQRCLVVADSFYEWKKENGNKTPMRVRLKSGKLFSFAGLWSRWTSTDGDEINSCTIITTRPNELMENIHDRMPVILRPEDEETWLNTSIQEPDLLHHFLEPYDADQMEVYEVSPVVNSPKNCGPECIEPANINP